MIVKLKSYKTPRYEKLLNYLIQDKDRTINTAGQSFLIQHNLKGDSIQEWVKHFEKNESYRQYRRKDNVMLFQEIVSFDKKDTPHLTLKKMETLARAYIQLRNPKGVFLIVPHFDRSHAHFHCLVSPLQYKSGKSLSMSKTEFQSLKQNLQSIQISLFPELSHSIVEHGRHKNLAIDSVNKTLQVLNREKDKQQLLGMLKTCYKKSISKETFVNLAKESGIGTYRKNNDIGGVVYNRRKYSLNKLGFTQSRFEDLERMNQRMQELSEIRSRNIPEKELNVPLEIANEM